MKGGPKTAFSSNSSLFQFFLRRSLISSRRTMSAGFAGGTAAAAAAAAAFSSASFFALASFILLNALTMQKSTRATSRNWMMALMKFEGDLHCFEIDASGDKSDDRADEVVDEAVDDCCERTADDDADCHVEDVAARDELLEFSEKTCVFQFSLPLFLMY